MEKKAEGNKKKEHKADYSHSKLYPHTKPAKKSGKNIILQKETWIFVSGIIIAIFVLSVLFMVLWGKYTILFYWLIVAMAIFFTRKTDLWKMGIEIHFPLMFYVSYTLGPLFAFSLFIIGFGGVWKVRPDEGTGIMIQSVTMCLMIGVAQIMKFVYGPAITASQFFLAFVIAIVFVQVTDGILSKMFCPSAPMKIFILHSLDVIINIYVAKLIGYQILRYLMTLS
ncbi:MAG: hypothetical protein QF475_01350 [Candidatus Undinarchaeales archaeon]|nr:hypothetical protein [Candidatus Undinarchaeales archaeon]